METVSIFVITIINKGLLILFIFNGLENFAVEVKNYKHDYLHNDWKNKDATFINQTSL